MLNMLKDYIYDSLPHNCDFSTNPNLSAKIDNNGLLRPFRGNTAVFLLDSETIKKLEAIRNGLYENSSEMLAEKLDAATFHLTLHDLKNEFNFTDNPDAEMIEAAEKAVKALKNYSMHKLIRMKTTHLFNMVNTSIVLGLEPCDEESYKALDELYCALEDVVRLGYALTPHITMAYFRPGIYDKNIVEKFRSVLTEIDIEIVLSTDELVLQNFTDMNNYFTVRKLI